jgi:V/A-type H+-transporting ATPase subunit E
MALQSLLDALTRRTMDEVAAVREAARAEAAAILQVVDHRASDRRAAALHERERALRDQAERAVVAARREGRRLELEARERLLRRVVAAVRERLPAAAQDAALRAAVPAKLTAACNALGDLPAVVHCAAGLADLLRPLVKQRDHLAIAVDADLSAGFRVESADGHVSIDATLDGCLERDRQDVLLAALAVLSSDA